MAALQFLFRERDAEDARYLPRAQKQELDAARAHPLNGVTRNLPRVIQS